MRALGAVFAFAFALLAAPVHAEEAETFNLTAGGIDANQSYTMKKLTLTGDASMYAVVIPNGGYFCFKLAAGDECARNFLNDNGTLITGDGGFQMFFQGTGKSLNLGANGKINLNWGGDDRTLSYDGTSFKFTGAALIPGDDDTSNLGSAAATWAYIYAFGLRDSSGNNRILLDGNSGTTYFYSARTEAAGSRAHRHVVNGNFVAWTGSDSVLDEWCRDNGDAACGFQVFTRGDVRINAEGGGTGKPTCNSTNRGRMWRTEGGAGVADTMEYCKKDAADAYAWTAL